jgi:hypothetical protein
MRSVPQRKVDPRQVLWLLAILLFLVAFWAAVAVSILR